MRPSTRSIRPARRPTRGRAGTFASAWGASMVAASVSVGVGIACVPTRGGWDVEALRRAVPAIAAHPGERLGDLVPFPALVLEDGIEARAREVEGGSTASVGSAPDADRIDLVVCRFAAPGPVRVAAAGAGWAEAPGSKALAALADALASYDLALTRVASGPAEIGIEAFATEGPELPEGLGDTLVECDVTPREVASDEAPVVGAIRRAEVRMRRSGRDAAGRLKIASDDAWTGALLHELGHALGFAGHAATGRSLLVRDEHVLRGLGREVLRGEPLVDPTLAALHALEPGRRLGRRRLRPADADWVRAVRELDRRWTSAGVARVGVVASVGDREARWSMRYADGRRLGLRFPGWPQRLREGQPILVFPDRETLDAIRDGIRTTAGDVGISP